MNSTKKRKLIIDRSKWLNNFSTDYECTYSELLNEDGNMCCLGFAGAQLCGAKRRELLGKSIPEEVAKVYKRGLSFLLNFYSSTESYNSNIANELIHLNDDHIPNTPSSRLRREKKITEIFAKQDIVVKFVGRYPEYVYENQKKDKVK